MEERINSGPFWKEMVNAGGESAPNGECLVKQGNGMEMKHKTNRAFASPADGQMRGWHYIHRVRPAITAMRHPDYWY